MKQTAVEWLVEELTLYETPKWAQEVIEQAKAMEKEQIIEAYCNGDDNISAQQYYNETFGGSDESKCVFEARTDTSSATICKWCGQEKFLHKY
jgi:hypothetical protein